MAETAASRNDDARTIPAVLRRLPLLARIALAVVAVGAAVFLWRLPLTSVLVLIAAVALILVVSGLLQIRGQQRVLGAALILQGVVVGALWSVLARNVPIVVPLLVALYAAFRLASAVRKRRWADVVRHGLLFVIGVMLIVLSIDYPDLIVLGTGFSVPIALVIGALWLMVTAPAWRSVGRWSLVSIGVAATVAALVVTSVLSTGVPKPGAFYAWKDDVPSKPGVLLRSEPYTGKQVAGATSQRILYSTRDVNDKPVVASAVVAIPNAKSSAPRTVLAWQHGTTGVAQPCAPSLTDIALSDEAHSVPGAGEAIARGWAVVVTDYPGQGTDEAYPYLVGVGEGRASLDAVRAAGQLAGANLSNDVMLWGHSQGGHATLWAAEIAKTYAPEVHVKSVAALSAAYDPLRLARGLVKEQTVLAPFMTSYVLIPYSEAYSDVSIEAVTYAPAEPLARAAAERCVLNKDVLVSLIGMAAASNDVPIYTLDLSNGPEYERLQQNIATGDVEAPLFLGQGIADEVIPVDMQRTLAKKLCAEHRPVSVHEYPGRSHMGVLEPESGLTKDLFAWVDQVERGQSPTTCG